MMDDKTGWEIVWDGTQPLIPPRDSHPSEVWNTEVKRKYTWTGRHIKSKRTENEKPQNSSVEQPEVNGND